MKRPRIVFTEYQAKANVSTKFKTFTLHTSSNSVHTIFMAGEYHFIRNALKFIGITVAVYLFMDKALPIVFPFFVAIFVAGILNPWKNKIMRKPNVAARARKHLWVNTAITLLLLLVVILVILGILFLFGYLLVSQAQKLWLHKDEWMQSIQQILKDLEKSPYGDIVRIIESRLSVDAFVDSFLAQLKSAKSLLSGTFGGFITVVVIFVGAFLLLKEYPKYHAAMMKSPLGEVVLAMGKDLKNVGGSYLKAQLTIMAVVIGICIAGLFLTGNSYALILGIVIGFFDALPFIGTAVIFIPWAIIKLLQNEVKTALIYIMITGIATVTRQYLEPKLIGDKVGANPFLVLFSIYVGIQLFGLWGFILGPVSAFLIWEFYR